MTDGITAFDVNGVKIDAVTNGRIKNLKTADLAATETLLDIETGLAYQVPAGKKLTIFYVISMTGFLVGTESIASTTVVNSVTGRVDKLIPLGVLSNLIVHPTPITENLYVTKISANAADHAELIAWEEDA